MQEWSCRLCLQPDLHKKLWRCPLRKQYLYGIKKTIGKVACPQFRPALTDKGRSSVQLGLRVHQDMEMYIKNKHQPGVTTHAYPDGSPRHSWATHLLEFEEKVLKLDLQLAELTIYSRTKALASAFDHCAIDRQTGELVLVSIKTGHGETWNDSNCYFSAATTGLKKCKATPHLQAWFQLGLENQLIRETYGVRVDRMIIISYTGQPLNPIRVNKYPHQVFGPDQQHNFWDKLYQSIK